MSIGRAACHCIVCQDIKERDPGSQSTAEIIHQHGWQVTMVPADDQGPGWAYTIGLWHQHRIPELAMFGLDISRMQTLLNDLARRAVEGQRWEADQELYDIANVRVVLKGVDYRWYKAFFGTAIGYYRKPPFPFLQAVWPNRDGAFPWQPGGRPPGLPTPIVAASRRTPRRGLDAGSVKRQPRRHHGQ